MKIAARKFCAYAALAAALIFALSAPYAAPAPASANSGPPYYFGSGGVGIYPYGECPLEVESELLTFYIEQFPDYGVRGSSRVTAEYTFYNPSEEELEVRMLFPYGTLPDYFDFLEEGDSSPTQVTAEGKAVNFFERLSFGEYYGGPFDFGAAHKNLSEEPVEYGILSPELPVTAYTVTAEEGEKTQISFSCGEDTLVFVTESFADGSADGGHTELDFTGGFTVCFAGETPENILCTAGGVSVQPQAEQTTFMHMLNLCRADVFGGVSDTDWFNYAVQYLDYCCGGVPVPCNLQDFSSLLPHHSMRWLDYTLTVPAGGRVKNAVTVPIYPDIVLDQEPYGFNYLYYLSPAEGWADFGGLTVRINTSAYLTDCSLEGFEREGDAYVARFDGLPQGELEFELCTVKSPRPVYGGYALFIALIIGGFAIIIAGIIFIIVFAIKKHRRRGT